MEFPAIKKQLRRENLRFPAEVFFSSIRKPARILCPFAFVLFFLYSYRQLPNPLAYYEKVYPARLLPCLYSYFAVVRAEHPASYHHDRRSSRRLRSGWRRYSHSLRQDGSRR